MYEYSKQTVSKVSECMSEASLCMKYSLVYLDMFPP
jgi:hypothetical protein